MFLKVVLVKKGVSEKKCALFGGEFRLYLIVAA